MMIKEIIKKIKNVYWGTVTLSMFTVPATLIAEIWFDNIPTGKIIGTCVIYFLVGMFILWVEDEVKSKKDKENGNSNSTKA